MTRPESRRLVMVLEYDGTRFRGSQVQRGQPTIQGELAHALDSLTGERPRLTFAGRTDAGAHALGQVASAVLDSPLDVDRLVAGVNHYLPASIAVRGASWAPLEFDVRRAAVRRRYRYLVLNSPWRSPLWSERAHHWAEPLDVARMNTAAQSLVGRRDTSAFVSRARLGLRSPLRTICAAQVWRKGERVQFELEGDSFLPHQIRRTVGALLQVGSGRMSVEEFAALATGKGGRYTGPVAPAGGLYLVSVSYPEATSAGVDADSATERNFRGALGRGTFEERA